MADKIEVTGKKLPLPSAQLLENWTMRDSGPAFDDDAAIRMLEKNAEPLKERVRAFIKQAMPDNDH